MGKPMFKSPDHELKDPLSNIMAAVVLLKSTLALKDDKNPDGMDGNNYASRAKTSESLLFTIEAEVDKVIRIDNRHAEKAEKEKEKL